MRFMPDVRDDFDLFDDVFDNGFDVPMFNQEPVQSGACAEDRCG